jgi:metallo-beta-lactamase family protein
MAARSFELTFLGATGTITGARYLLASGEARVLVDSGLFQGFKQLRLRNRAELLAPELPPARLDAVVLTHAHVDHSGHLPRLCRAGFRGPVYCTPGTAAMCRELLPDMAELLLQDAAFANKSRSSSASASRCRAA